ncbi:hypothetical protein ACLOAV_001285 [Pseudogymnoascus australis]
MLAPPPIPSPESPEGQKLTSALRADAEALPLAKSMAGEEWEAWDAYTTPGGDGLANRLTSGPLAGYGGIGYQRVFYNKTTGEYVVLAWLGRRLSGWPGVVHGGLLATLLDECLARTGMRGLDGGVGVTARLELGYKRPVKSCFSSGIFLFRVITIKSCVPGAWRLAPRISGAVNGRGEGMFVLRLLRVLDP